MHLNECLLCDVWNWWHLSKWYLNIKRYQKLTEFRSGDLCRTGDGCSAVGLRLGPSRPAKDIINRPHRSRYFRFNGCHYAQFWNISDSPSTWWNWVNPLLKTLCLKIQSCPDFLLLLLVHWVTSPCWLVPRNVGRCSNDFSWLPFKIQPHSCFMGWNWNSHARSIELKSLKLRLPLLCKLLLCRVR